MPSKIFCILSRKISDDLFLVVQINFSLFSHQLSNFTRIRSLDAPPVLHHAPETTCFYFFFGHLPTFCKENWPLGCPLGWMPGPSHRAHPPLHATATIMIPFFSFILLYYISVDFEAHSL